MREIEVKILDINREAVEKKLLELGAKKVFEGELIALHFETLEKSLKKEKLILRLRKEGNKNVLCLKEKVSQNLVKEMIETEIEVSDFENTLLILKKLGYLIRRESSKRRMTYKLGTAFFEFDKYSAEFDFIPEFLEIESESKESVIKYANLLGFKEKELTSLSTNDLIKRYKK